MATKAKDSFLMLQVVCIKSIQPREAPETIWVKAAHLSVKKSVRFLFIWEFSRFYIPDILLYGFGNLFLQVKVLP
jgi:hypothetical protein